MQTVSYSELRKNLDKMLDGCERLGKRFRITQSGRLRAVLVSGEEWAELEETLAILSDPDLMRQIVHSEADIRRGRVVGLDEARAELLGEKPVKAKQATARKRTGQTRRAG